MTDWGIKYRRNEIVQLTKHTGEVVNVRIEGVNVSKGQKVIYYVREIDTAIGYPAGQTDLKKIPEKSASR